MGKNEGQIVIKKYATGASTIPYEHLRDPRRPGCHGEEGRGLHRAGCKSGEDITHSVLTQIIFEQESKTGNTLLPIPFSAS